MVAAAPTPRSSPRSRQVAVLTRGHGENPAAAMEIFGHIATYSDICISRFMPSRLLCRETAGIAAEPMQRPERPPHNCAAAPEAVERDYVCWLCKPAATDSEGALSLLLKRGCFSVASGMPVKRVAAHAECPLRRSI